MTVNKTQQAIIPAELHGERVDYALAKIFPQYSRSLITQWLKNGLITINNQYLKPKHKVNSGDNIVLLDISSETHSDLELHPEPMDLDIIFEDEHLLIINKPAGLVVHPGAGNKLHTLMHGLLHHDPNSKILPRAGIIHRLDKDTTGLLIVAKSLEAYTLLVRQMQERKIHRSYLALVHGHVVAGGEIETFYGRHPINRLKMAVCRQGREAITHYRVKKKYRDYCLLDVKLLTGRTHQIRVHMAHIKHPIVGDPLYGGRTRIPSAASPELIDCLSQFQRQALHAFHLEFYHPINHTLLNFSAALPQDFTRLLKLMDELGDTN